MSETGYTFTGRCHCGGISVELTLPRTAEETQVRACQCGFCTRHGSLTVSDPAGKARIVIEAGALSPYRFGTQTSTALVCARCGVYAGIAVTEGARVWSVANARGLALDDFRDRVGVQMSYDDETPDERLERRKQKWTPTELILKL